MPQPTGLVHAAHRSSPSPAPGSFTHRQIVTILLGLMLGVLLAALDQTIVSTAIRTIADDLHGLSLQAWATTAYLITATISTPLYGKLSDLYGRKPFFLTAISIFIIGSVLCTFSTSMYQLAAFRAVQGLGAGGLISLAFAIIGDIVPPRERARYQGYFLAVFGAASVVGPLAGGAFAGAASIMGFAGWRWVFLVNVPIAVAALIVVYKVLNIPHTPREHHIDWPGALTLTVGVIPILLVAEQGRDWGWASASAIGCYLIAAAGLSAFIMAERRIGDDALLPLRLFRNGVFSLTSAAGLIIGTGMFGGLILLPQYLQIVKGISPTEAGLRLLPLMGGIMAASLGSGQLTSRTGRYKIFPVWGTALMTAALLLLYFRLDVDTSLLEVEIYMALFGLGLGGCLQTLIMAAQNAVPARDMGVATASATFFRQMGGTLGVAVFLSILFSTAGGKCRRSGPAEPVSPEMPAGCCRTPHSCSTSIPAWPGRFWWVSPTRWMRYFSSRRESCSSPSCYCFSWKRSRCALNPASKHSRLNSRPKRAVRRQTRRRHTQNGRARRRYPTPRPRHRQPWRLIRPA
jgi:EmrB/QacA subfamily drug resistance transporter